jgi:cytoskeleton protein RodZ
MPSIGETLREARMRQRLDIADVEDRTKIRAKYLRALENEEFGMLPGPTFVKTFLRTYAEMLGLDPHVLVEEYRASFDHEDEVEQPLGPPAVAGRDRRHGPRLGPGSLALLALVAVLAVLVAIGLASDEGGSDGQADRPATTATETGPATETQAEPPPPRRVALRLVPATPIYVCVDHGLGTEVVFENTIDSPQRWRGRRVRVLLGRRDARLVVNGEQVEVTPGADPIAFAFTPRRTREIPSAEGPCV